MNRARPFWKRIGRKPSVTLGDELAQCLSNGIDYEPEEPELHHPRASNDNLDTFRTVRGFGPVPYRSKVNWQDKPQ